jgi:neutral ceramidase
VQREIVTAMGAAKRKRVDTRLSVARGREERSSFNSRFTMANGRVHTHPGKGKSDIVGPAGPIDPEVAVLGAWSTTGELLGCLANTAGTARPSPAASPPTTSATASVRSRR